VKKNPGSLAPFVIHSVPRSCLTPYAALSRSALFPSVTSLPAARRSDRSETMNQRNLHFLFTFLILFSFLLYFSLFIICFPQHFGHLFSLLFNILYTSYFMVYFLLFSLLFLLLCFLFLLLLSAFFSWINRFPIITNIIYYFSIFISSYRILFS
jgi:cellulose synthase/poly-beta-1,6-N-acetylglucosamine synthase-like glycosyltransferase